MATAAVERAVEDAYKKQKELVGETNEVVLRTAEKASELQKNIKMLKLEVDKMKKVQENDEPKCKFLQDQYRIEQQKVSLAKKQLLETNKSAAKIEQALTEAQNTLASRALIILEKTEEMEAAIIEHSRTNEFADEQLVALADARSKADVLATLNHALVSPLMPSTAQEHAQASPSIFASLSSLFGKK